MRGTAGQTIRIRRVAAAGLTVLVAGACGAPPAAASPRATKAGYITSADRVCRRYDDRVAAIPRPPSSSPLAHHEEYAAWGRRARAVFDAYDKALGALPTPASAKSFVAAWHKVKGTAQAYISKFVTDGVFANYAPEAKSLVRANKRFGTVSAAYGFADCGRRYRAGKLPH
jgi:hypothetical protein